MATIRYNPERDPPADLTSAQNERLERMTREEIEANAAEDADNPPSTDEDIANAWKPKLLRDLRERLNLSQAVFATSFGINARTLQDWEQGRRVPDQVARSYLRVIAHNPEAVKAALRDAA